MQNIIAKNLFEELLARSEEGRSARVIVASESTGVANIVVFDNINISDTVIDLDSEDFNLTVKDYDTIAFIEEDNGYIIQKDNINIYIDLL